MLPRESKQGKPRDVEGFIVPCSCTGPVRRPQGLKPLLTASATLISSEGPHGAARMLPELDLGGPDPFTALHGSILGTFYRRAAIARETLMTTEK